VFTETTEQNFRIPKTVAQVTCHSFSGEKFEGEIYLDGPTSRTPSQILDFFNSDSLFLPVKTSANEPPRLISKNSLVLVNVGPFTPDVRKETSSFLTQRKKALFLVQCIGSIHAEVLIDTPDYQARVLDVLNLAERFLPILVEENYCLLNSSRIFEVMEL
jgi:hypothetical protein